MAIANPYNYSKPSNFHKVKVNPRVQPAKKRDDSESKSDPYLEQKVMSASPQQLTLMLYEGAIRFLKLSRIHMESGKVEESNLNLTKAQRIINELNITLDAQYDVSKNLSSLYEFMLRRISEAMVQRSTEHIDEVIELIDDLRGTWKDATKSMPGAQG